MPNSLIRKLTEKYCLSQIHWSFCVWLYCRRYSITKRRVEKYDLDYFLRSFPVLPYEICPFTHQSPHIPHIIGWWFSLTLSQQGLLYPALHLLGRRSTSPCLGFHFLLRRIFSLLGCQFIQSRYSILVTCICLSIPEKSVLYLLGTYAMILLQVSLLFHQSHTLDYSSAFYTLNGESAVFSVYRVKNDIQSPISYYSQNVARWGIFVSNGPIRDGNNDEKLWKELMGISYLEGFVWLFNKEAETWFP
jgi:hypothetical protein